MNKTYGSLFQDNLNQCQHAICEIICPNNVNILSFTLTPILIG